LELFVEVWNYLLKNRQKAILAVSTENNIRTPFLQNSVKNDKNNLAKREK
jgi:hypothetical protein